MNGKNGREIIAKVTKITTVKTTTIAVKTMSPTVIMATPIKAPSISNISVINCIVSLKLVGRVRIELTYAAEGIN